MRLFVAVHIPGQVREALAEFCDQCKASPALPKKVKWVEPENLHLTLKFFGEIEENRLEDLSKSLSRAFEDQEPFSVAARGIGIFPEKGSPRVLWAGIGDPDQRLRDLADSIDRETVSAGFPPSDHLFSAHLTLARFPLVHVKALKTEISKHQSRSFGEIRVQKSALVRSRLGPSGAVYTDLKEFYLHDR